MKKLLCAFLFLLLMSPFAFGADTKITGLSEDATPTTDDLVVTVNDPAGTPANRKVTVGNIIGLVIDDTATNGDTTVCWSADKVYDELHAIAASQITSGTLTHERGGLEADVNAYDGIVGISGGATIEVNTAAELETYAGLGAFFSEYADDPDAATMRTTLGLGSAATRAAEDTMTNGSNLPDGAAIIAYGNANWSGGGGTVTGVGDCASGACLDGTSDGGSYIRLYDGNSNYSALKAGDSSADLSWTFPTAYPAGNDYLLQVSTAGQISTTNTLSSVTFGGFSNSMAVQSNASGELESSSTISTTELGYLNGVTSAIQTQLDAKEDTLTNSAGLRTALSDESGTGAAIFAGGNIGAATATTPSANDNDTSVATTAYVQTELTAYASDSVTFTNKTIDADGTGNSLTNVDEDNMKDGSDIVTDAICFMIDGGGSAITTGVKGYVEVPFNCTIKRVTMIADQSGSIVVDIWKDTYANALPTDADSITASAVPTISSAVKSQDATLTGWTTSITAGDILGYNVDSASTVTLTTICLKVEK